jgi:phosphoribosyl-ATP pyrophosphohydrolase/phosphoribosyl-AMP cyclohydrolase
MTLLPTIVQDARTGRVLMLGWSNDESRALTAETGRVHFWSRSKERIWMKGETSGNVLEVVDVSLDCDEDTILIRAIPAGPTCHTGSESCFGVEEPAVGVIVRLSSVIASRAAERPDGSYTVTLLDDPDLAARKVLEEAGEVSFAAKDHAAGTGSSDRVAEEAADLLYHLLVLLENRGVAFDEVTGVLAERAG